MLHTYRCWHYLCRETARVILALNSFDARREMARDFGCAVSDILAKRT